MKTHRHKNARPRPAHQASTQCIPRKNIAEQHVETGKKPFFSDSGSFRTANGPYFNPALFKTDTTSKHRSGRKEVMPMDAER